MKRYTHFALELQVVMERESDAGRLAERRVLVLSDCAGALQLIETAWRRGVAVTGREGSCGALLEEICAHRRRLGIVVMMYTPGHSGISANEYADMAAKAHVMDEPNEMAGMNERHVRTRPCVYARGG